MADPIFSKTWILRQYDEARRSLDPIAAVEHVAGVTGMDIVQVECVVQGREAMCTASEAA